MGVTMGWVLFNLLFFFLTSMDLLPLNREENFMLVGNLN